MAVAERLSDDRREGIAGQLGARLRRRGPLFTEGADYGLAESLPVWLLDLDQGDGKNWRELCVHSGTWHHQVKQGEAAVLVARSIELNEEARDELSLAYSELAEKVARAIAWADSNISDDWSARLLFVPPVLTYALWFERDSENRLYVVDSSIFPESAEIHVDELVASARAAADDWGPLDFELPDEA